MPENSSDIFLGDVNLLFSFVSLHKGICWITFKQRLYNVLSELLISLTPLNLHLKPLGLHILILNNNMFK